MTKEYYIMTQYQLEAGECVEELKSAPLTLDEVRRKVTGLVNTEDAFLCNVAKYRRLPVWPGAVCVGSVSADEFDGDVPDYD